MGSDGVGARSNAAAIVPRAVAVFGSFRYGEYFEDLLEGVVAAADVANSRVISIQTSQGVLASGYEFAGQEGVSRVGWDHFDGAIVILQAVSLEYVAALRAAGKFVVAIGQTIRGATSVITIDNVQGIRDAVTHLFGHGHSEMGFASLTWQADALERYDAYAERMVELGLAPQPRVGADLDASFSADEQGYLCAREWLAGDRRCTAMLVVPDLITRGFVRGLQEAGVSVPEDVAVVGFDDDDASAVNDPPLATVAVNFRRVGEVAFNVALRGGRGEVMDERYTVPQRFVPRESCGCPSGSAITGAAEGATPQESFCTALALAAQESALEGGVDLVRVQQAAGRVVGLLQETSRPERPLVDLLAEELNDLVQLDRSIQAMLRAVRELAEGLATAATGWAMSSATLELCDAVREGQLQRRMSEYVELKRGQLKHYFIGNSLLGHDRSELRSMRWLSQTEAQAGALGLWQDSETMASLAVQGVWDRSDKARAADSDAHTVVPVESFPPTWMLRNDSGDGSVVVITAVRFEDSNWGLLAVSGGHALQSSLVQETFQQWAILMSASLDQEQADVNLARQAHELTEAYQTEMALLEEVRISEERYALAAEAAHDALWDWDTATGRVFYSSPWKALLGHRDNEIGTGPDEWLDRVHADDALLVQEQLNRVLGGVELFFDFEHRLRVSSGEYRWIACSGRSVLGDDGRPSRLVGSITDVTVRRLLQDQLVQEALFDGLTGLAKSTLFKDRLTQAIELSKRRPDYWFAVLFVDLDGFKAINDTLGHAAGDELLASVAQRLKDSLRRNDTAARLGGDEFAILLNDVSNVGELPLIINRIKSVISSPHLVGGHTATVGAAIGVAISSTGYASGEDMLHDADTAMYRAKRRSKSATLMAEELPG